MAQFGLAMSEATDRYKSILHKMKANHEKIRLAVEKYSKEQQVLAATAMKEVAKVRRRFFAGLAGKPWVVKARHDIKDRNGRRIVPKETRGTIGEVRRTRAEVTFDLEDEYTWDVLLENLSPARGVDPAARMEERVRSIPT